MNIHLTCIWLSWSFAPLAQMTDLTIILVINDIEKFRCAPKSQEPGAPKQSVCLFWREGVQKPSLWIRPCDFHLFTVMPDTWNRHPAAAAYILISSGAHPSLKDQELRNKAFVCFGGRGYSEPLLGSAPVIVIYFHRHSCQIRSYCHIRVLIWVIKVGTD